MNIRFVSMSGFAAAQVLACRSPLRFLADSVEGIGNLLVEIASVGHDHDARGRVGRG